MNAPGAIIAVDSCSARVILEGAGEEFLARRRLRGELEAPEDSISHAHTRQGPPPDSPIRSQVSGWMVCKRTLQGVSPATSLDVSTVGSVMPHHADNAEASVASIQYTHQRQ